MGTSDLNNLTGCCLISTPALQDEPFEKSVIYICSHGKHGAMGFVVNKKIKEFSFSDLALQLPINFSRMTASLDLYRGGPLDKVRGFVLHSTDYVNSDSITPGGGVAISASIDILTDIAYGNGPKDNLIALGYANWAPNQLEQEIINNMWLVVPASPELVFHTKDEEKWNCALDNLGVDITRFCTTFGRA